MRAARKKTVSYNYNSDDDDFENEVDHGSDASETFVEEDAEDYEPDAEEKFIPESEDEDDEEDLEDDDFDLEGDSRPEILQVEEPPRKKSKSRANSASAGAPSKGSKTKKAATASKRTAKVPTLGEKEAYIAVRDYMEKANRPYSVINVFDNLHKSVAKPMATKILDNLVEKSVLGVKIYGKSKIYYASQDGIPDPTEDELADLKAKIESFTDECRQLESDRSTISSITNSLCTQLTDEKLNSAIIQLEVEVSELTKAVNELDTGLPPVSSEAKLQMTQNFDKFRTAWLKRKRIVTEAVNMIAEGMDKKPKAVMETCGVETDSDVGVESIPQL